jgi:hypothetical protein
LYKPEEAIIPNNDLKRKVTTREEELTDFDHSNGVYGASTPPSPMHFLNFACPEQFISGKPRDAI